MPCTCRCGVHLKKNAWPWTAYTGFHACTLCICKSQPRQWCNPLLSRTLHTHTHTISIPISLPPFLHHSISSPSHPLSLSPSLQPLISRYLDRTRSRGPRSRWKGWRISSAPSLETLTSAVTKPSSHFYALTISLAALPRTTILKWWVSIASYIPYHVDHRERGLATWKQDAFVATTSIRCRHSL